MSKLATVPPPSTFATVQPTTTIASLAATLATWIATATDQYRGRGPVLRALALAMVCARPVNVLLLGPPGTAKSAMADALAKATASRFLDVQFSPWTDVADLLGPIDLAALQANRLVRATDPQQPYLYDADMGNFDELPRGAPGIRAASLRPLAERKDPRGVPLPRLHVIIATANTRLTTEEDRALVDRFALRVDVPRIMSAPDLRHVIGREVPSNGTAPTSAPLPPLAPSLIASLRAHAATVDVPGDVLDALTSLALALRQPAPGGTPYPDVSERRWIIVTRLLQASAALAGRSVVDWTDLVDTLPLCLDDGAESRPGLLTAIHASIPKWVRALSDLDAACRAAVERARRVTAGDEVPGVDPIRADDGNGHAKREAEFSAFIDALKAYGAEVRKRADDRVEACRDAIDEVEAEMLKAKIAARKARK